MCVVRPAAAKIQRRPPDTATITKIQQQPAGSRVGALTFPQRYTKEGHNLFGMEGFTTRTTRSTDRSARGSRTTPSLASIPAYKGRYLTIDDAPLGSDTKATLLQWARDGRLSAWEDLALVLKGVAENIGNFQSIGEWRASIPVAQLLVDAILAADSPPAAASARRASATAGATPELVAAAKHIRANMAHYGTTDYTETGVVDVHINNEHIDNAVLQANTAEANARTTAFPGPNGTKYLVALDHHHANAKRGIKCGTNAGCDPNVGACSVCPGITLRRFPDDSVCHGVGSESCGGWSARIIWIDSPENEESDEPDKVRVNRTAITAVHQTYGPAPGQMQMRFTVNLPEAPNTPIRVTYRAPRAGPVLSWIAREIGGATADSIHEFANRTIFKLPVAAEVAPFTLDYLFGLSEAETRDAVIRVLKQYPLGSDPERTVPALSAVRGALIRAVAASNTVVSDEIAYLARHPELVAGLSTQITADSLMAALSPREAIASALLRMAAHTKAAFGNERRAADLAQAARLIAMYTGRWDARVFAEDETLPRLLRTALVRNVIHDFMLGFQSGADDRADSEPEGRTTAAQFVAKLIAEVPSITERRAAALVRRGLDSFYKLAGAHDVLAEHELLSVRYRNDLFSPIPRNELAGAWEFAMTAIFGSPREGLLTREGEKIDQSRWTFVGPVYSAEGSVIDPANWTAHSRNATGGNSPVNTVHVAFLARPEYGAKYLDTVRIGLAQRFRGEFLPVMPARDGSKTLTQTLAASATTTSPVRRLTLHIVTSEAEWPFQITRLIVPDAQWAALTARARRNGIFITPAGVDARLSRDAPIVRSVADVFALAGVNIVSETDLVISDADTVLPTPDPNEPSIVPVAEIAAAVGAAAVQNDGLRALEIEARIDDVNARAFYALVESAPSWYGMVGYAESSITYFAKDDSAAVPLGRSSTVIREERDAASRRIVAKTEHMKLFDPFSGVRFSVATEEDISALYGGGDPGSATLKRQRKRWSVRDNDVRIDMTRVETFDVIGEALVKQPDSPTFEIELEALDLGVVHATFNQVLLRVLRRVFDTPLYYEIPVRSLVFKDFNESVKRMHRVFFPSQEAIKAALPAAFRGARGRFGALTPSAQEKLRQLRAANAMMPNAMLLATGFAAAPRNLKRRDLTQNGLGGSGRTRYTVSLKADGVTAFLFVHFSGIWVVSPPLGAALVLLPDAPEIEAAIEKYEGCVVIGEDVPLASRTSEAPERGARMFVPFDLIAPPHNSRAISRFDANDYLSRYAAASAVSRELGALDPTKFFVVIKTVAPIKGHTPESVSVAIRELREDAGFKSDGYIFTPISAPSNPFGGNPTPPLHRRVLSEFPDVCKFKPWNQLTVDLRLNYAGGAPVLTVVAGGGARHGGPPSEKPFAPEGEMFDFENRVDWRAAFFTSALVGTSVPDGAVIEFGPENDGGGSAAPEQDEEMSVAMVTDQVITEQEREFLTGPTDPRRINLVPRRLRLDKPLPNQETIANDVWDDVKRPLDLATVAGSTNFELLFQQNNRLKTMIFNRAFDAGQGAAVLVDLGSGQGGDLHKFAKHIAAKTLLAVILVEPNDDNYAELLARIAELPPHVGRVMFPVHARAEDLGAITAALRSVLDELYQAETPAERVAVSMMLSLSFFFSSAEKLAELGATLSAIQRVTAAPVTRVDGGRRETYRIRTPVKFHYFTVEGERVRDLFNTRQANELTLGPARMVFGGGVRSEAARCSTVAVVSVPCGVRLGAQAFRVEPVTQVTVPSRKRRASPKRGTSAAIACATELEPETLWIDIRGKIVRDQTEYLVDLPRLEPWLSFTAPPKSSLIEPFLSADEIVFGSLFVYGEAQILESA